MESNTLSHKQLGDGKVDICMPYTYASWLKMIASQAPSTLVTITPAVSVKKRTWHLFFRHTYQCALPDTGDKSSIFWDSRGLKSDFKQPNFFWPVQEFPPQNPFLLMIFEMHKKKLKWKSNFFLNRAFKNQTSVICHEGNSGHRLKSNRGK